MQTNLVTANRLVAGRGGAAWGRREGLHSGTGRVSEMTDVFVISIVVLVSWVYTYIKTYQIIPFKCVSFIVHQPHLDKKYQT